MFQLLKNPKIILAVTLAIVIPFVAYNLLFSEKSQDVLSEKTQASSPSSTPVQSPLPSSTPTPTPLSSVALAKEENLSKSSYTVAVIGDSMVDTMGENMEYLEKSLTTRYPGVEFKLYNYGIGGQNAKQGLERLNQSFSYQTRSYPPITQINADVIIIASFAYNPFAPHNRDQHWLTLTELVNQLRQKSTVYMLAEIAPLKTSFGVGPGGINWPADLANQQAENIRQQLENAINLSKSLGVPLINAYSKSTIDGKFGDRVYVSTHDGIHPSVEGHLLMADLIAQTIKLR